MSFDVLFWRNEPLSANETKLLNAVESAHRCSALRNTGSSGAVLNAASGSGRFEAAIASGILALGGKHGPIADIVRFLDRSADEILADVETRLSSKRPIPGWGNSFFKGRPDPDWVAVDEALKGFPIRETIALVSDRLHKQGKRVFPNAGCFTAATAIILRMPAAVSPYLLIYARLPVWASLAAQYL